MKLEENKGIPGSLILAMAILAGVTVANLYYNQPLLELIKQDINATEMATNLITVITQIGYALGLFFVIPMGDLYSRRRIIITCMLSAALFSVMIAFAPHIAVVWAASLLLGVCSVVPQLFMPIGGQFSKPQDKSKNMGYILSGLLTGILAARVVSGLIGHWLGWREMFGIAAVMMLVCCGIALRIMPEMKTNFHGNYRQLMGSIFTIVKTHPKIRVYALRGGCAFGSMLAIWSCMAFHLAGAPFHAGSDKVGLLGLCGIVGAVVASGVGKYIPKYGIRRFSLIGALLQLVAWAVCLFWGNAYAGLVTAVIVLDIGLQCQQISNQSGCIQELPEAANRCNTIFMTTYFIGGSLGTFLAGIGWTYLGWAGVCVVGTVLALCSMLVSLLFHR